MSRTFAAAAPGLPAPILRAARIPELEGNRLRLIVERKVFGGGGPRPERGAAWFYLSPTDDVTDHEAMVSLPLVQAEALERACAAFNCIMDAAERDEAPERKNASWNADVLGQTEPLPPPPPPAAPRAQALATAAAQVAVLAVFLPAVACRCLGLF